MRLRPWLIAICAMTMTAGAQERSDDERIDEMEREYEQWRKMNEVLMRAQQLRPRRRDEPLRELNLSDDEVREIQQEIREIVPPEYMNISPVVSGCVCEEGPDCSAQVFVVSLQGTGSRGVQLSRVARAWKIGAVQKWWLEYDALEFRAKSMDGADADEALRELINRFPSCQTPTSLRPSAASR
jgi:hypothetical protein